MTKARKAQAVAPAAPEPESIKPTPEPVAEQVSAETANPDGAQEPQVTASETPAVDPMPEPEVAITESGAAQPVATIDITHLRVAQMTPEIEEGDTEIPTQHVDGSIAQFKGLDRRTMRLAMTDKGLRAVAVEGEA